VRVPPGAGTGGEERNLTTAAARDRWYSSRSSASFEASRSEPGAGMAGSMAAQVDQAGLASAVSVALWPVACSMRIRRIARSAAPANN